MNQNQFSGLVLNDLTPDEIEELVKKYSNKIVRVLRFDKIIQELNNAFDEKEK